VDVSGKPENGQNVTSNASADVEAQEAKISVAKALAARHGMGHGKMSRLRKPRY